jgi:hypothetical protein
LVKTERIQAEEIDTAPGSAWLIGLAAWFIPGAGHLLLSRWGRAALMGGSVWLCLFLGIAIGRRMYHLNSGQGWSAALQVPPMIGNLGVGALYIVSWLLGVGFTEDPQQAARVTYEYGYIFLIIAGLLNYLTMLDAFDIAAGRKS